MVGAGGEEAQFLRFKEQCGDRSFMQPSNRLASDRLEIRPGSWPSNTDTVPFSGAGDEPLPRFAVGAPEAKSRFPEGSAIAEPGSSTWDIEPGESLRQPGPRADRRRSGLERPAALRRTRPGEGLRRVPAPGGGVCTRLWSVPATNRDSPADAMATPPHGSGCSESLSESASSRYSSDVG